MFIEYHVLQNFAPNCLNRDDTNSPKDCVFGGVRRARISSQCQKRAIRQHPAFQEALPGHTSIRTKRMAGDLARRLALQDRDLAGAEIVAAAVINSGLAIKTDKEHRTSYLLFVGSGELDDLAATINEHWDLLQQAVAGRKKPEDKIALPAPVERVIRRLREEVGAVDLALFGRMVADLPEMNVDATCQVAHAISTNEVTMEMDFYTAVDDLNTAEETGAGMMGVVEFNSSCFYRYAVLDVKGLQELLGDKELVSRAIAAFTRAIVEAIPTGKQNSMAAHNLPDYVRVIARTDGPPCSLANAFVKPPRPDRQASLLESSIQALETYQQRLNAMYGYAPPLLDFRAATVGEVDGPLADLYRRIAEVA